METAPKTIPPGSKTGADAEDRPPLRRKSSRRRLGPLGSKLHTGRAERIVATDFRLFVIDAAAEIKRGSSL